MSCPYCHADTHTESCPAGLLPPLAPWRDELQQRLEAYRARRGERVPAAPPLATRPAGAARVLVFPERAVVAPRPGSAVAARAIEPVADPVRRPAPAMPVSAAAAAPAPAPAPVRVPAASAELDDEATAARAMLQIPLPLAASEALAEPVALMPASAERRFQAAILDGAVIGAGAVLFAFAGWASQHFAAPDVHTLRHLLPALVGVPGLLAGIYIAGSFCAGSGTWGMRQAGLEVRSFDGAVTRTALRRRGVACLVSLGALGVGYLWALCDSQRLAWHDYISRTYLGEVLPPRGR